MRRAPQEGQNPRRLQLKATSLSCPQSPQRSRKKPQEAVGQDAAFQKGVELVFDELRQVRAGCRLGLLEEGGCVLLHQAVQHGLLGAVTLVVDRGAVRCPDRRMWLRTGGLHALLMSKTWCSEGREHRSQRPGANR
jgi:hypothetical protein